MGISNGVGTLSGMVCPLIVGAMTKNKVSRILIKTFKVNGNIKVHLKESHRKSEPFIQADTFCSNPSRLPCTKSSGQGYGLFWISRRFTSCGTFLDCQGFGIMGRWNKCVAPKKTRPAILCLFSLNGGGLHCQSEKRCGAV